MPRVVGEIVGGLVMSPTILGFFFPQVYHWMFNAFESEGKLLAMIYWLGLVLLMFGSGFEIQKSLSGDDKKTVTAIFIGSTALPLLAGWAAPRFYDFSWLIGTGGNLQALFIVIAIATAVTSIPVISKIFIDLKIMDTRFAKIVLATATTHDILLYVMLAVATGLVGTASASMYDVSVVVTLTLGFFVITLLVMPCIIRYINASRYNLLLKSSPGGYVLFICFLFAAIASVLKVNVVFGALLAGMIVGMLPDANLQGAKTHIKEMSLAFFTPLYFAIVGLQLDLIRHFDLFFFIGFFVFTSFFSIVGTMLALRFIKKGWFPSFNYGVAMCTRGGPGIVLASVALSAGIINETFYSVLVMVAIVTSLLAGYWFQYVLRQGWQLD
jgi:Kef-type K+ transport system membrane component KefB